MSTPRRSRTSEEGIALVMVIIFTVLLYVLVAELVVTARMQRLTGENDALLARMRNHMEYTLTQVEEQLADDLAAAAAQPGAEGAGLEGLGGMAGGAAGGAGGEGEGEAEEPNDADSSQDAWYEPAAYSDDDLSTYVWVEDENRKFNVLALASPDVEFAEESRRRFVRLVDHLREDSIFDLSSSTGETIANAITDWLNARGRTQNVPRPPLKSDAQGEHSELTIPLHLGELLMLRDIDEDVFYDKVVDRKLVPGLESVITIYTSLKVDPGDPETLAAISNLSGPGSQPAGQPPAGQQPAEPGSEGGAAATEPPMGIGIKININTASRAVLRCLFPPSEVPDAVIDAILRHRNEEEEEEEDATGAADELAGAEYFGDLNLGEQPKRKIFKKIEDLEELPEFQNMGNPELKQRFTQLTTVKSDVFSVHMASMYKRSEERRVFVLRRAHSVLVRFDQSGEAMLHPLVLLEECDGVRVMPIDFPDEYNELDYQIRMDDLDMFAADERRWNPFYLEFYFPPEK